MESIEETNTVGESTDLYQVVTGEAHQVGAGETRKRVQVGGKTVGLQPRHGLLRGRASHKTSLRATAVSKNAQTSSLNSTVQSCYHIAFLRAYIILFIKTIAINWSGLIDDPF